MNKNKNKNKKLIGLILFLKFTMATNVPASDKLEDDFNDNQSNSDEKRVSWNNRRQDLEDQIKDQEKYLAMLRAKSIELEVKYYDELYIHGNNGLSCKQILPSNHEHSINNNNLYRAIKKLDELEKKLANTPFSDQ